MKLILSRKGVDSAAGRCASALVDGRPISIPIPTTMPSPTTYGMLENPLRSIADDLSGGRLAGAQVCHLDPDIDAAARADRPTGWRGALGQVSASLSHLRNQHVGAGDLFLFWGLYRPAEHHGGLWRYVGPRQHVMFGWLKIAAVVEVGADGSGVLERYPWLEAHPHVRPYWTQANVVYVASESLQLDGRTLPGSGVFKRAYHLTAPSADRPSLWSVPDWLNPKAGGVGMTYHGDHRWHDDGQLQAAARGQEFVADIGDRQDAITWLADLLENHT